VKLVVRPKAEVDIDAAAEHYVREENIALGLKFYDAVDRTFSMLLEEPFLGARHTAQTPALLPPCRRWRVVQPFNAHQVFYIPLEHRIEVLRLLHGARDIPNLLAS